MRYYLTIISIILSSLCYGQGNGLYKFRAEHGKCGFINAEGKIIIQPEYLVVRDFSEGLCFVAKEKTKLSYIWLCIDTLGRVAFDIGTVFPETNFSEGFARIGRLGEHWFIDKKGERVFDLTFKDARGGFSNGYALVSHKKFEEFRFIDKNGKLVEHLPFVNATVFNDSLSSFYNKGINNTIFNICGDTIISNIQLIEGLSNDLIKVKRDGKWGFIDRHGNVIIDFQYEQDRRKEFDKILKLNTDSPDALPKQKFRNVGLFYDGLAFLQKDSLWGFIDPQNEFVIEPKFKKVRRFSEGLAGVSLDGETWGFINTKGDFVIEPKFYLVDRFENGVCAVRIN